MRGRVGSVTPAAFILWVLLGPWTPGLATQMGKWRPMVPRCRTS